MVIDLLARAFDAWRETLPRDSSASLRAYEDLHEPRAARLDAESSRRAVEVTVWGTGEVDRSSAGNSDLDRPCQIRTRVVVVRN
jgi:hypothetical protein